jgi:hypothetical protein
MKISRKKYALSQDEGRWERQTIEPAPRGDCRAEIWGSVIIGAAALGGGYLASQGASEAADAQAAGGDAAIAEQRRQFNTLLSLTANQRGIGNQALNALGGVYGYRPTAEGTGVNSLAYAGATRYGAPQIMDDGFLNTNGAAFNPWTVTSQLGDAGKILDPAGGIFGNLFGNKHGDEKRNLNAFMAENKVYDLGEGMLGLADGTIFPQSKLQEIAGHWYGATYAPDGNQEGWQQSYNALIAPYKPKTPAAQGANVGQAGNGLTSDGVQQGFPGPVTVDQEGNIVGDAPNYRSFFASPDYQFRLNEGLDAVQNSAAARGGLYSGNALRGINEYGQGVAAGAFNDWFKNNLALAGIGTGATSQAGQGAMATGANVGNLLIGQGNARASGIVDQTNALTGTLNQLGLLAGTAFDQYRGYRPNSMASTGYGVPYGGRLA